MAVLIAIVIAGLAAVGFRNLAPHWPAISERWEIAIFETVETDPRLPIVEPLPGMPPGSPSVEPTGTEKNDDVRVITHPSWLVRPQSQYPRRALRQGIESGQVQLTCPVSASGEIQSCWIVSETPADAGFGQAALAGAVQSRLQPRTIDGMAVATTVSFTMKFRLE